MIGPSWLWESAGAFYAAVSGWLPDVTMLGAGAAIIRNHTCHSRGCFRFASHPFEMDGVEHKLCRHCHPILKGQRHTRAAFHAHHASQQKES